MNACGRCQACVDGRPDMCLRRITNVSPWPEPSAPKPPTPKIPVSVAELRKIRHLVEVAGRLVHSNARMVRDEKVPVLANLKKAKTALDDILQLSLFPASQLEG